MISKGDKILFISQHAGFIGGLDQYIFSVSNLLRENGFKTYSLYVEKAHDSARFFTAFEQSWSIEQIGEIKEDDFTATTLHKISQPDILSRILKRFSPTLFVHDHDYFCPKGFKYYPYKRINCRRSYSPIICGICSSLVPPRHITGGICAMLKKNFISSCQLFKQAIRFKSYVVLSDFMRHSLINNGISAEKITILHPFLKMPNLPKKKVLNNPPQIVFAAQQVMSKGTPLFLEAIKKLKNPVIARILGTGTRLDDFKKLSLQMGLGNRVHFDGWIPNPQSVFMNSDVAVFPSLWQEPFGLSGIEAMSCGIPVVGFDVGGVSEWLRDGLNGILIPERDTTAMAEALDRLITNSELRNNLGKSARTLVSEVYSQETFLKHFSECL